MTDDDLKAIEELAEKATPAPWRLSGDRIVQTAHLTRDVWTIPHRDGDMAYIATACNLAPRLVAEIRRLRAAIEKHRASRHTSLGYVIDDDCLAADETLWATLKETRNDG